MAYLGVQPGSRSVRTVTSIVATASQTVFNVNGGYTKGFVDVYKQGLKLKEGVDFTATDSISVVLTSGATVSDKVEIVAYSPLAIYSVVSKAGDAMTGNLTVPNLISSSNVSGSNGYFNNLKVDSNTVVNSSLTITGNTTQTGDVTLTGNLNLTGSLIITGAATSVTTQSLAVEDSIIIMAANNTTDTLDIGFAGNYDNGSGSMYAGMVRNATDKSFYLFDSYENVPGNDIDLNDPSFNIANLHANFNGNLQSNSISVVQLNATNGNFTSSITLSGDASGYRQDTTTVYGGDAGVGFGRLEYHDNRWIINSGSDSSNVAVFQRGNLVKSFIDNDGAFHGPLVITGTVTANGGTGSANQVLTSNGTGVYWAAGGVSLAGSNTSIQFNDSGALGGVANLTFDKSTNVLSIGNSTVNTVHTANGIVVAGDTGVVPASNSIGTALGTSTARWVVSANTGDFTGTVTGTTANMSTSVNSAQLTVGTSFIANTTGAYHTGIVNAASLTTSGFVANATVIAPTSNTILLGNSIGRFVLSANTINASGLVTGGSGATFTGQVNASTGFGSGTINATSNGLFANESSISLGNTSVNVSIVPSSITVNGTGVSLLTVGNSSVNTQISQTQIAISTSFIANTTGAYHSGTVNAASHTTSGFVANTTAIAPTSNTILLGNTVGRFVLSANTGDFTGAVTGTSANMSTSVNSALLTVGTNFIANTTQVTIGTGVVLSSNGGVGSSGQALLSNGSTGSPYWGTISSSPGATYVQNTDSRTLSGNLVISGTYFNPSANTILLGNSISRWVVSANTGDFTGAVTGTTANMSTSVNSALLTVGTNFIANTTQITIGAGVKLSANGGLGSAGQLLSSNGSTGSPYWTTVNFNFLADKAGGTGDYTTTGSFNAAALTAGTTGFIANTTQVTIGTGVKLSSNGGVGSSGQALLSNGSTGSPYWGTISASPGATYVQNTDSRTLSGNLVISGTYFNPSANTILLGNSISRWVVSANTGDFTGIITGTSANMSTSVNSALLTVGTNFIANTLGVYHAGTVNAVSFTTSGFSANTTAIAPTSNTILLGNTTNRFVLSANTGSFSGAVSGITTLATGNVTATGFVNATSTIQGGAGLIIAGAASGITTLAAGNTTITGFANVSTDIFAGGAVTSDQYRLTQNVLGNVTGATTININNGSYITATATGAVQWSVTNSTAPAQGFILKLTNGGIGTQTWMTGTRWPNAVAPTLRASGVDVLTFITDDSGSTWRGVLSIANTTT